MRRILAGRSLVILALVLGGLALGAPAQDPEMPTVEELRWCSTRGWAEQVQLRDLQVKLQNLVHFAMTQTLGLLDDLAGSARHRGQEGALFSLGDEALLSRGIGPGDSGVPSRNAILTEDANTAPRRLVAPRVEFPFLASRDLPCVYPLADLRNFLAAYEDYRWRGGPRYKEGDAAWHETLHGVLTAFDAPGIDPTSYPRSYVTGGAQNDDQHPFIEGYATRGRWAWSALLELEKSMREADRAEGELGLGHRDTLLREDDPVAFGLWGEAWLHWNQFVYAWDTVAPIPEDLLRQYEQLTGIFFSPPDSNTREGGRSVRDFYLQGGLPRASPSGTAPKGGILPPPWVLQQQAALGTGGGLYRYNAQARPVAFTVIRQAPVATGDTFSASGTFKISSVSESGGLEYGVAPFQGPPYRLRVEVSGQDPELRVEVRDGGGHPLGSALGGSPLTLDRADGQAGSFGFTLRHGRLSAKKQAEVDLDLVFDCPALKVRGLRARYPFRLPGGKAPAGKISIQAPQTALCTDLVDLQTDWDPGKATPGAKGRWSCRRGTIWVDYLPFLRTDFQGTPGGQFQVFQFASPQDMGSVQSGFGGGDVVLAFRVGSSGSGGGTSPTATVALSPARIARTVYEGWSEDPAFPGRLARSRSSPNVVVHPDGSRYTKTVRLGPGAEVRGEVEIYFQVLDTLSQDLKSPGAMDSYLEDLLGRRTMRLNRTRSAFAVPRDFQGVQFQRQEVGLSGAKVETLREGSGFARKGVVALCFYYRIQGLGDQEADTAVEVEGLLAEVSDTLASLQVDGDGAVTRKTGAPGPSAGPGAPPGPLGTPCPPRAPEPTPPEDQPPATGATPTPEPSPPPQAPPVASARSLTVEALIDGDSDLHLIPQGLYWVNGRWSKPGRHGGRHEPTWVNEAAWQPGWSRPEEAGPDRSSLLRMNLPVESFRSVQVLMVGPERTSTGVAPRETLRVEKTGNELVVHIPDSDWGSAWYRFRISSELPPPSPAPTAAEPVDPGLRTGDLVRLESVDGAGSARWLEGQTSAGTALLGESPGAGWEVLEMGSPGVGFRCLASAEGPRWLNGRTVSGEVDLSPDTENHSGTRWLFYTAPGGLYVKCAGRTDGFRWLQAGADGRPHLVMAPTGLSGMVWRVHRGGR